MKIRRLSEREAELRGLHARGLTRRAIADAMGVAGTRIDKWLARLGLTTRRARRCAACSEPHAGRGLCPDCAALVSAECHGLHASRRHPGHARRLALYRARAAVTLPLFGEAP